MLINRIGDFFILGGILLLFGLCKSVDFFIIFSQFNLYLDKFVFFYGFKCKVVDLVCLLLFLGAITKSAQIFFHG
jgi:NADH-quinone oxidoreductase subunit L